MLYDYECVVCELIFDEFVHYKDRHKIKHCGKRAVKLIATGVYTEPDQSYKFETNMFGDDPVQVNGRGHYRKLLKKHGMGDYSAKEGMDQGRRNKRFVDQAYKEKKVAQGKRLAERMQEDNVSHVAKDAMKRLLHKKGTIKTEV